MINNINFNDILNKKDINKEEHYISKKLSDVRKKMNEINLLLSEIELYLMQQEDNKKKE